MEPLIAKPLAETRGFFDTVCVLPDNSIHLAGWVAALVGQAHGRVVDVEVRIAGREGGREGRLRSQSRKQVVRVPM